MSDSIFDKKVFTFIKGKNTEAKHTSYPEDYAREIVNVNIHQSGKIVRRLGLVLDTSYSPEYSRIVSGILPLFYTEEFTESPISLEGMLVTQPPEPGEFEVLVSLLSGVLRDLVVNKSVDSDFVNTDPFGLVSGILKDIVITQTLYDPDSIETIEVTLQSGTLVDIVIIYDSYDSDDIESSGITLISGSLS